MNAIKNKVSSLVDRLRGRTGVGVDVRLDSVHIGNSYGGYAILPARVHAGSIVYSFGIGEDVSFDLGLIERFGCTVHGFDPTPRSIAWVAEQKLPAQFVMHGVGLADYDGVASFAPPKNPKHISHHLVAEAGDSSGGARFEFQVKRLPTLMAELGHEHVDLLKMDIESAEYGVLDALLATALRPPQLLVEFHHGLHGVPTASTQRAVSQLRAVGYQVFDVQPSGRELSFVLGDV